MYETARAAESTYNNYKLYIYIHITVEYIDIPITVLYTFTREVCAVRRGGHAEYNVTRVVQIVYR